MADQRDTHTALGDVAARQLANATKTVPQMSSITPRWLTHLLQWVPVEAGIYRVNRVKDDSASRSTARPATSASCPQTFVDYEENPREYMLSAVTTVLDVHTRVSDLYSSPYDQIREQLRLTIETSRSARRASSSTTRSTACSTTWRPSSGSRRAAARPRPTISTSCLSRVWKEPAFFLAHPAGHRGLRARVHAARRAAAHGDAVRLPVPHLARAPLWSRPTSVPKPDRREATTASCCCASARRSRAWSGSSSRACPASRASGLSVRFMGINRKAIART